MAEVLLLPDDLLRSIETKLSRTHQKESQWKWDILGFILVGLMMFVLFWTREKGEEMMSSKERVESGINELFFTPTLAGGVSPI
jgi:hypothetical protein